MAGDHSHFLIADFFKRVSDIQFLLYFSLGSRRGSSRSFGGKNKNNNFV